MDIQERLQRSIERERAEITAIRAEIDQLKAWTEEYQAREAQERKRQLVNDVVDHFKESGLNEFAAQQFLTSTPGDFSWSDIESFIQNWREK